MANPPDPRVEPIPGTPPARPAAELPPRTAPSLGEVAAGVPAAVVTGPPAFREAPILDDRHQLPAHRGKVGRITDHVKGAAESLTEWIELRIALLKREVKDEVDSAKRQATTLAKAYGIAAVLALLAGLILLLMAGFLLSALWGLLLGPEAELWSLTLGYLTLGLLLGIGGLVALKRAQRKQHELPLFDGDKAAEGQNGRARTS